MMVFAAMLREVGAVSAWEVTGITGSLTVILGLILPWWSNRQKAKHDAEITASEIQLRLRDELRLTVDRQGADLRALQEELGEVRSRSRRCEEEREALSDEMDELRAEVAKLRSEIQERDVREQAKRRGMAG